MNELAQKVSTLLPGMEAKGVVYLFALVEREDVDRWDVVVSSVWSDRDAANAVRWVSDELVPRLEKNELAMLSRIVVIPSKEPSVFALTSSMGVAGGSAEIVDCNFMGLRIKHAFLFKAQRPPKESASSGVAPMPAHVTPT